MRGNAFLQLLHTGILATIIGMQIPCRGRGQAPQPDAVNEFCWTVTAFNQHCQREGLGLWTIVHCTHGFNRTGNTVSALITRRPADCDCSQTSSTDAL